MNLLSIRMAAGIGQDEFSKYIGVSRPTLSKMERGLRGTKDVEGNVRKFCSEHSLGEKFFVDKVLGKDEATRMLIEAKMAMLTISGVVDKLTEYV